jgi:hypothetical protein
VFDAVPYFFTLRRKDGSCPCSSTHSSADRCALATAGDSADRSADAGAAGDNGGIPLLGRFGDDRIRFGRDADGLLLARPRTLVPFDRTVLPSITTGSVRLARKGSPALLLSELTASNKATRSFVPAGTTTLGSGFGLSTASAAAAADVSAFVVAG